MLGMRATTAPTPMPRRVVIGLHTNRPGVRATRRATLCSGSAERFRTREMQRRSMCTRPLVPIGVATPPPMNRRKRVGREGAMRRTVISRARLAALRDMMRSGARLELDRDGLPAIRHEEFLEREAMAHARQYSVDERVCSPFPGRRLLGTRAGGHCEIISHATGGRSKTPRVARHEKMCRC